MFNMESFKIRMLNLGIILNNTDVALKTTLHCTCKMNYETY